MPEKKTVISQIQSAGEDALGRIAKTDTARSAMQRATELRDRAGKTLAGLERIEKRLDAIEERLAALEGSSETATGTTRSSSAKSSTVSKSSGEKPKAAD